MSTTARAVLTTCMEAYERRTGFYGIGKFFEELGIIRLVEGDTAKTEVSPTFDQMLGGMSMQGSDLSICTGVLKDLPTRRVESHGQV